ncbi:MAG: adenosine deaminase [Ignavibacteriaceae bacterium]|nr:adenosine deaminase [Ignavibacteriaceae bacterium]
MNYKNIPKVELHLHLDCSLSFEVVNKINSSISLEDYYHNFIAPPKCANLAEYIKRASQGIALMQTEGHLRFVVDDLFKQLKEDNVIYAEIRFAPLLHLQNGLNSEEVVRIVDDSAIKAIAKTGIEARLILCTLRHFSEEQSLDTVKLVHKFKNTTVAGFDLAADEAGFSIDNHIKAFEFARENSIFCTSHAGEAKGPKSIYETLEYLKPSRIGHGVRCIEDSDLMKILKEKNIHLEVCPTSNIQTNVFENYQSHPIHKIYKSGISVGINTDARTLSNISLSDEYQKLHETFGWTKSDFQICNKNALRAAFLNDEIKNKLIKKLEYQSEDC